MTALLEEKDHYLSDFTEFEKEWGTANGSSFQELRQAAIERFAELGFPTTRQEEWRFTNVTPLTQVPFKRAGRDAGRDFLRRLPGRVNSAGSREGIVFVNGQCAVPFEAELPSGVLVLPMAKALAEQAKLVTPHLARLADYEKHPFVALNTAFFQDGAFVYVPRGVIVEKPIHLLFVTSTSGEPIVAYPRNLIVAGENCQVTIVESYLGSDGDVSFTNAVTEVVAAPNAIIDHYKVQRENDHAYHIATLQVHQDRASNFSSHSVALGGALVRNDVNAVLDAEGCHCVLNGLSLGNGRQLIDNHTRIDHAKPRCESHELYKTILNGKAHGVFNGKIYVHADAQKTDAKQTNQTLLLSGDATIDAKPQLEIYADDVKCTHGATVGQLDENSIFYLRSRGIGMAEARSLLTFAFANDIVERIKVAPVRRQLEDLLLAAQGLPRNEEVQEEP
jgi:Fe-S cluster assembly protein SufD